MEDLSFKKFLKEKDELVILMTSDVWNFYSRVVDESSTGKLSYFKI
ncbi:hypothetical protein [Oceanobacillus sojae]|nr:hypothetical protein [Oceanobacillus sojae]